MNERPPRGVDADDDLVAWLAKAAAWRDLPPTLVVISDDPSAPKPNSLGAAVAVAISPNALISATEPDGKGETCLASDTPLERFDPRRSAVLARFEAAESLSELLTRRPDWVATCAAVLIPFPLTTKLTEALAARGIVEWRSFAFAAGGLKIGTPVPPRLPGVVPALPLHEAAMNHLVIVDPCLGTGRGHYLQHARLLTAGARRLRVQVTWAANTALPDEQAPPGVRVLRCFRRCFIDLHRDEISDTDLSGELAAELTRLACEFSAPGAHLLFHSSDAHLLRAVSILAENSPDLAAPIHLLLHVDPRRLAGRRLEDEAHRCLLRLRRSLHWERSVFFWAENRPLAAWLEQWLQAPIPVAPALIGAPGPATAKPTDALKIAVLGELRAAKGFLELPALAAAIDKDARLRRRTRLFVQWSAPLGVDLANHRRVVAQLRTLPFVELYDGELTDADYRAKLAESNALLFPYDPQLYRLRGSGVLLEAIASDAAVIVREGSALAATGVQGLTFTYRRPEEAADILRRLLTHPLEFAARAARRGERFRKLNTPENFLTALDRRVRRLPPFSHRGAAV